MSLLDLTRIVRPALLFAAAITLTAAWPAAGQTSIKFSLDGRLEGLAATFFLPPDRGYFKTEGLDVTLDGTATMLEPITRVASGAYDMGLADINTLIKYRDQHPSPPVRAVFMVYNKPPFAIVARRSRGITEPKQLENKKLGDKPEAVRAFLHAFLKGLKDVIRRPVDAVDAVVRRDETLKKEVELERLRMAIRDNIVTPEVKADGYGAVDFARLAESIDQIGLVYTFKAKPKADDIFDASFLPPADERRAH